MKCSFENPLIKGKEGEGEILKRFHAVAKPSGGCLGGVAGSKKHNPQALRDHRRFAPPPLLGGNIFIERGAATRHEKLVRKESTRNAGKPVTSSNTSTPG